MDLEILNSVLEILALAEQIHKSVAELAPKMTFKKEHEWGSGYDEIYYFDHPQVDGKITKEVERNGNNIEGFQLVNAEYYITASVQYINTKGKPWAFAKVRIFLQNGDIKIKGRRTGSLEDPDYEDEDFLENPDPELLLVLKSMKDGLQALWEEMEKDSKKTTETYNPKWIRQLIRHNYPE